MTTKRHRRSSAEKAADDALIKRYKMLTGKQRLHGRVVNTCGWSGCLNAAHYELAKEEKEQ